MRVLLVEDESTLAETLAGGLRADGFFVDVAHELRTPLAALRARLEIDLRHPPVAADAETVRTRQTALQQVTRLADLVDDLLQLARLDADLVAAHGGRVWIDDNDPGARFCVELSTWPTS